MNQPRDVCDVLPRATWLTREAVAELACAVAIAVEKATEEGKELANAVEDVAFGILYAIQDRVFERRDAQNV